jgi:NAD+-dependent protein deacetylase SIR2
MLFTQNIDCLERTAGVAPDRIIEAHGSFASQRCVKCHTHYPDKLMREHVENGQVPVCREEDCNGFVKPDIVFFGERLPEDFYSKSHMAATADMAIIMGTSLTVYPFASLADNVRESVPRVLFNNERVGNIGSRSDDVYELGDCDSGVRKLAQELGWASELEDFWRDLVGEKEVERQLRSQNEKDEEIENELKKITEGMDSALHLRDDTETDEEQEVEARPPLKIASPGKDITKPDLQEIHAYSTTPESQVYGQTSEVDSEGVPKKDGKTGASAVANQNDRNTEKGEGEAKPAPTPPKKNNRDES